MSAMEQEQLPVETLELQGRPYFVSIEPCMSVAEVAVYARVTEKTVYRAAEVGLLVSGKARTSVDDDGGRNRSRLIFRKSDVDAWLFPEQAQAPAPRRRTVAQVVSEPVPVSPRSRKPRIKAVS